MDKITLELSKPQAESLANAIETWAANKLRFESLKNPTVLDSIMECLDMMKVLRQGIIMARDERKEKSDRIPAP